MTAPQANDTGKIGAEKRIPQNVKEYGYWGRQEPKGPLEGKATAQGADQGLENG